MSNYKLELKDFVPISGMIRYTDKNNLSIGGTSQEEYQRMDLLRVYNAVLLTSALFLSVLSLTQGIEKLLN